MWKNSLALAVSACLCIVAAEVALRFFTPFPLGTMTHRLPDPNLGYKLDPALLDVDDNGFRNAPGKRDAYEVAAIGDSMTYGNNVASAESWPAALERLSGMSTYNYGVGSYGIYSYHALVRQELERGDKKIIVALNIGNDFAKAFSYCDILKAQSVFWREEKSRLALHELESSNLEKPLCKQWERPVRWKVFITENVALVSAIRFLVWDRLFSRSDSNYFVFPDGLPRVDREYARRGRAVTALSEPDTAAMVEELRTFLRDWASRGRGRIGLLIIPTKESVVYQALGKRNLLGQADKEFLTIALAQNALTEKVKQTVAEAGIPGLDTTSFMASSLENAIEAGKPFFPNDDTHPYVEGYEAIGRAAVELAGQFASAAQPD